MSLRFPTLLNSTSLDWSIVNSVEFYWQAYDHCIDQNKDENRCRKAVNRWESDDSNFSRIVKVLKVIIMKLIICLLFLISIHWIMERRSMDLFAVAALQVLLIKYLRINHIPFSTTLKSPCQIIRINVNYKTHEWNSSLLRGTRQIDCKDSDISYPKLTLIISSPAISHRQLRK